MPRPLLLLAILCASLAQEAPSAEPSRPNVLFIAVDDMNDWVGCLGGYPGTVHTPHIDRLAARGVLFTNAHCASPKCAPSRAAVLLGQNPSTTGLYDNAHWWHPHLPGIATLPMHFRAHGYAAFGVGKIHHHTAGFNPPYQWDDFEPLLFRDDPWFRSDKRNYPWSESAPTPPGFPFGGVEGLGHENDWGSPPFAESELDDVRSVDAAIAHLRRSQDKPFFLACGIFRPHLPWYVPQRYFDLYELEEIVLPETPSDELDDLPAPALEFAADRRGDFELILAAGKWEEAVLAYLASISFADAQVGRLLEALAESPHASDTIVVFWSDHGWHLGEKRHWHKSTLWERATRVPLVVAGPGIAPGRCERAVSLVDLYPTLVDLCRLPPPDHPLDGESLAPLLSDPQAARERPAVTEFLQGNAAVRDGRYRYIRYHDGSEELYDHATDPGEWRNLAGDPALAAVREALARWLPATWAEEAPRKNRYDFDPETYRWTEKSRPPVPR